MLAAAALRLERGDGRILLLCSNTAHIAADPVAHLALGAGARRVGVLAPGPTVEQDVLGSH